MQGRSAWIALSVVVVGCAGLAGFLAWEFRADLLATQARVDRVEQVLNETSAELAQAQQRNDALRNELTAGEKRISTLQRERDAVTSAQRKLEQQMREALKSKEVTISQLKGRLSVNIVDRVMFDSGRAELKPEGRDVLAKVAGVLANVPDREILIAGHTDNVPVSASRHLYDSNWELSTARATSAVRYLIDDAGSGPKRLAAAGFGEFRPVADNETPAGRAKNRRITIIIMPEELMVAD